MNLSFGPADISGVGTLDEPLRTFTLEATVFKASQVCITVQVVDHS